LQIEQKPGAYQVKRNLFPGLTKNVRNLGWVSIMGTPWAFSFGAGMGSDRGNAINHFGGRSEKQNSN